MTEAPNVHIFTVSHLFQIFIERTDAEVNAKSQLIGKDPDSGKD